MNVDLERVIAEKNAVFDKDVGTWDGDSVVRPGPDAPPLHSKGVAKNRRIAGGRWLVVDYSSDSGFEGHGVYGWNPDRGAYTGIWVDSMGSTIAHSEGTWDAATRTMTFQTEAEMGGRKLRYRETTQTLEDGTLLYRNLVPTSGGEEFEMVRVTYRRRSGA